MTPLQTWPRFAVAALLCFAGNAALADSGNQETRTPSLTDIVEARSIDGLMPSPDGTHVAYRVISPSASRNETLVQWFSVAISGAEAPVALGQAHEPLWLALYDSVDLPRAAWAADSRFLYVQGVNGDQVQIFRLGPDGTEEPVTRDGADVVSFSVRADGSIDYQVRGDRDATAIAQAEEELRGVRLDRTLDTDGLRLTRNFKIGTRVTTIRRQDAAFGVEAFSGPLVTRTVSLHGSLAAVAPSNAGQTGASFQAGDTRIAGSGPSGLVHVSQARPGEEAQAPYTLSGLDPHGKPVTCSGQFCRGVIASLKNIVGTGRQGELAIFHERDFSARTDLYRWNPSTGRSHLVRPADGSLDAGAAYGDNPCPTVGRYALCVHAGPTSPPRLVRLDLRAGDTLALAEPNAALAKKRFAPARFLRWKDADGRISTGILSLPPSPQKNLPLVITTYRCRGFLKGSSGWMAAEHLLVQRGFASLCAMDNLMPATERDPSGQRPVLGPHKASIASYAAVIDLLATQGIIDRSRVGITGHSFSSMVVAYAISHTSLFATAVTVGNTIDANQYYTASPTRDSFRKYLKPMMGLPYPDNDPTGVLDAVSPARNAAKITAPLLLQTVEGEYLSAIELYTRIEDAGGTVDMYIFPDEGHLGGRQPAHLYWRSRRSADWFSFWLKGEEVPDGAAPGQYEAWHKLRTDRQASGRLPVIGPVPH